MITLYLKPGCPYCKNVMRAAEGLVVTLEINETTVPGVLDELIARGG